VLALLKIHFAICDFCVAPTWLSSYFCSFILAYFALGKLFMRCFEKDKFKIRNALLLDKH